MLTLPRFALVGSMLMVALCAPPCRRMKPAFKFLSAMPAGSSGELSGLALEAQATIRADDPLWTV